MNFKRFGALEGLGRSPADRRALLRGYFEPTPKEREEGRKLPTPAHRAIARLMKNGYVRVVLTTNFDRLLEQALAEEGMTADVISTPDSARGARPLIHSPATIIKLHGDYLDDRIKNTPEELASYPAEMESLLDRVLDEFGLVICGWSGDWDPAVRRAIERCTNHRFPTYWTHVVPLNEVAERLVAHRRGVPVKISGADECFTNLEEKVVAIATFGERHPTSARVAVATLERYLVREEYRIQLRRLVDGETETVFAASRVAPEDGREEPSGAAVLTRARRLLAATDTLLQMLVAGCYWGGSQHEQLWSRSIRRLMHETGGAGHDFWYKLANYPAQLLFYGAGLAALAAGKYGTLKSIFHDTQKRNRYGENISGCLELNSWLLRNGADHLPEGSPGGNEQWAWAPSEGLYRVLKSYFLELVPEEADFGQLFDRFEYLLTLAYAVEKKEIHGPPGRFTWRARDLHSTLYRDMAAELDAQKERWPPLADGILRADYATVLDMKAKIDDEQRRAGSQMIIR